MAYSTENYTEDGIEVVVLKNAEMTVCIAVALGNTMYSLTANDKEYLYFPFTLKAYKESQKLAGNPFMHPWANRLATDAIMLKHGLYSFPESSHSLIYRDGNGLPLHGLLLKSDAWTTTRLYSDENASYHEAILSFDRPEWLAIFPFEHVVRMRHILQGKTLRVEVDLINNTEKEMPVSFGFHPYFLKDRNAMQLTLAASDVLLTNEKQIPIGSLAPKEHYWKFNQNKIDLSEVVFDHGFANLHFDERNAAVFGLDAVSVEVCQPYSFVQVYAPAGVGKEYVCIEPMTAATNALQEQAVCSFVPFGQAFSAAFEIKINA